MTRQHTKVQPMTNARINAVSYYLDKNSFLPGMTRPHTYKGWHAYWQAVSPNGLSMSAQVVGPFETREEALSFLYKPHEEAVAHKDAVRAAYDAQ